MTQLPAGDWLIMKEAAELIGISSANLSMLCKNGRVPHVRIGRQVMILRKDAIAYRDSPRKRGPKPKQ